MTNTPEHLAVVQADRAGDGSGTGARAWGGAVMSVCTCQGGEHQPEGVQYRADDCPMHGVYGSCRCGAMIEPPRAAWAETCEDCMAAGCPKSPEDALRGDPCDACDCVSPDLREAIAEKRIMIVGAGGKDLCELIFTEGTTLTLDQITVHELTDVVIVDPVFREIGKVPFEPRERTHPTSPRASMRRRR